MNIYYQIHLTCIKSLLNTDVITITNINKTGSFRVKQIAIKSETEENLF